MNWKRRIQVGYDPSMAVIFWVLLAVMGCAVGAILCLVLVWMSRYG